MFFMAILDASPDSISVSNHRPDSLSQGGVKLKHKFIERWSVSLEESQTQLALAHCFFLSPGQDQIS